MGYNILRLVNIAKAEEKYLEKASNASLNSKTDNAGAANYTKYWRDLCPAMQGQPWCDAFVSWVFIDAYGLKTANELLCGGANSYYTPTSASLFKKSGRWENRNPKVGDVIYFKNSERIYHTGIVVGVDGDRVYTCEGNTSGADGVVPNGGGVFCKSYPLSYERIAGYGRPDYGDQNALQYPKWVCSGGNWYYRIADGVNAHGWMDIKEEYSTFKHRYYFYDDGKMATDWAEVDKKWYYFQPNGSNVGQLYRTDESGAQAIWYFT
jgi:hypothetical protein